MDTLEVILKLIQRKNQYQFSKNPRTDIGFFFMDQFQKWPLKYPYTPTMYF